jgi:hypothetical protein
MDYGRHLITLTSANTQDGDNYLEHIRLHNRLTAE